MSKKKLSIGAQYKQKALELFAERKLPEVEPSKLPDGCHTNAHMIASMKGQIEHLRMMFNKLPETDDPVQKRKKLSAAFDKYIQERDV